MSATTELLTALGPLPAIGFLLCVACSRPAAPSPETAEKPEARPSPAAERPGKWAVPIEKPGLPNFHRVSEALYRGAQPTDEGMRQLQGMGIRTVVNLRSFHSDRDELKGLDLRYEHIFMKAWHPEREEVVRFLKIAADPGNRPVLVHCQYGADRTGLMCAIYRVALQGWTKAEAADEMKEGGFGHHAVWKSLVDYLEKLDVEGVKREAGVEGAPHAEGH